MMQRKIFSTAVLTTLLFAMFPVLQAGPTVIQDDRVTNLATTPVLGRGYSIATNTFQSTCLADVKITQPSYDFSYSFQEMDEFMETNTSESDTLTKLAPKGFRNFITRKYNHSQSFKKGFNATLKGSTTTTTERQEETSKKTGVETTTVDTTKETKTIIASIDIHSYYASVDESSTKLSASATQLLIVNNIPGFVNACGSYYVRSIGRKAQFISVFEFESVSEEKDQEFTYQLETEIKSFRRTTNLKHNVRIRGFRVNYGVDRSTSYEESLDSNVVSEEETDTFSENAKNRKLTITATAFGLGKNENASLISYDIDSFKSAIKDAFLSMQNPRTGKVDSIEVVPWVENTEFQSLIKLNDDVEVSSTDGDSTTDSNSALASKLLLYEKKMILNMNSEFLAELGRTDRAMLNIYYKAKLCRKTIDNQWAVKKKGKPATINPKYAERYLMNNRYEGAGTKLVDLNTFLTTARVNDLLTGHREFIYGGGDWGKGGARACMNKLMKPKAIFSVAYRDVAECKTLEENLGQVEDSNIENYCMPRLFTRGITPEEVTNLTTE
ncbi:MAG: hypothetical protein GY786_03825 [Proteobacteria bacterium]|nr:hypothetical protein [Pseudomonadota bacterium]